MNNSKAFYSPKDLRFIAQQWQDGTSDQKIANALGRTAAAIAAQRKKLGLIARHRGRPKSQSEGFSAGDLVAERRVRAASNELLERLLRFHPEGHQDGPVKAMRLVHYAAQITYSPIGSSMA